LSGNATFLERNVDFVFVSENALNIAAAITTANQQLAVLDFLLLLLRVVVGLSSLRTVFSRCLPL